MTTTFLTGDCRELLKTLPDQGVQCCVTSPPYWGLRDYGVSGQIGLEPNVDEWVATLVDVFREVRRVLRDDGVLWLNLGDAYAESGGNGAQGRTGQRADRRFTADGTLKRPAAGIKPKDLIGLPWMVAFALRADGWYLRSDIIWAKNNPMPESVRDRPTKAHEYLFLLTKQSRYYFDQEAVKEPSGPPTGGRQRAALKQDERYVGGDFKGYHNGRTGRHQGYQPATRNLRSVWAISTQAFPAAHFATFPEKLVEPCIKAGSRVGDTVLDPFSGAGTVGKVAERLGRDVILIDLNPAYTEMARERLAKAASRG